MKCTEISGHAGSGNHAIIRARMDAAPTGPPPTITRLARALGLVALEAASTGLFGWVIAAHKVMPDYVRHNDLPAGPRGFAFIHMGIGLVGAVGIVTAVVLCE